DQLDPRRAPALHVEVIVERRIDAIAHRQDARHAFRSGQPETYVPSGVYRLDRELSTESPPHPTLPPPTRRDGDAATRGRLGSLRPCVAASQRRGRRGLSTQRSVLSTRI